METHEIEKKINQLGGLSIESSVSHRDTNTLNQVKRKIKELEERFQTSLPKNYCYLQREYAPFCFNNYIEVKSIETLRGLNEQEGKVRVGCFFGLLDNGVSIFNILDSVDDLPLGYLPFCEGVTGDVICINLNSNNYGRIYYWFHEAFEGEELILVSNNFDDFIMSLEVVTLSNDDMENSSSSNQKETVVRLTPELLELLKKTGNEPENYELI